MNFVILNGLSVGSISNYIFHDLKKNDNVRSYYLYYSKNIKNHYLQLMYNLIRNKSWISRENRIQFLIDKIIDESSDNTVVIMTNEMLQYLNADHIQKFQNNGLKVVLVLIDPLTADYITVKVAKEIINHVNFDQIFTFDPNDATEYGLDYCNTIYSKIVDNISSENKYDICYFGNIKDRLLKINELLKESKSHHVNLLLKLSGCSSEDRNLLPKEAVLKHIMPYEKLLMLTQMSNCIFDMTQDGQTGVTFRYYEAIIYNKKLITNNKAIQNLPYYDNRYIKFYNNIKDIDWGWVKKRETIDYGYNGEFSPLNLLKRIEMKLDGDT